MGLIKTAIMTGGGLYAVNKGLKVYERQNQQQQQQQRQRSSSPSYQSTTTTSTRDLNNDGYQHVSYCNGQCQGQCNGQQQGQQQQQDYYGGREPAQRQMKGYREDGNVTPPTYEQSYDGNVRASGNGNGNGNGMQEMIGQVMGGLMSKKN